MENDKSFLHEIANDKSVLAEVEKTLSEKLDEVPKKTYVDPKFCQHEPADDGTHKIWPGKTALCKKCGVVLVYGNREPGSRVRMSKKERLRKQKGVKI